MSINSGNMLGVRNPEHGMDPRLEPEKLNKKKYFKWREDPNFKLKKHLIPTKVCHQEYEAFEPGTWQHGQDSGSQLLFSPW